jgi:putative transposase
MKEESGMYGIMKRGQQVNQLALESIALVNQKKPHLALNMKTPGLVYKTKIPVTCGTGIY